MVYWCCPRSPAFFIEAERLLPSPLRVRKLRTKRVQELDQGNNKKGRKTCSSGLCTQHCFSGCYLLQAYNKPPTTRTNFWQQAVLVMNNLTETAFNLRCLSALLESTLKTNEIELFPTDFLNSREKHLSLTLNQRTMFLMVGMQASHNFWVKEGEPRDHSSYFSNLEVGEPSLLSPQTSFLA